MVMAASVTWELVCGLAGVMAFRGATGARTNCHKVRDLLLVRVGGGREREKD